jgi:hypothetical protein
VLTSSPPADTARPESHAPIVLLVTPCPWTARAIEVSLDALGLATLRAPDVELSARLCAADAVDAVIIDERTSPLGTNRGAESCQRLLRSRARYAPLPVMLLARDLPGLRQQEAVFAAGAWGIASYPTSGHAWIEQLATWVRARDAERRDAAGALVDPATQLYNAEGLARRAREAEAAARRVGGPFGCGVITVHGPDALTSAERLAAACRRVGRASDVFGWMDRGTLAAVAPGAGPESVRALLWRIARAADATVDARVGVAAVEEVTASSRTVDELLAGAVDDLLAGS